MSKHDTNITPQEIAQLAATRAATIHTMREKWFKAAKENIERLASVPEMGMTPEQEIADAAKCRDIISDLSAMVAARHGPKDAPGQTTFDDDLDPDDGEGDGTPWKNQNGEVIGVKMLPAPTKKLPPPEKKHEKKGGK